MTRAIIRFAIPAVLALGAGTALATDTGAPAPVPDQTPVTIELDRRAQERDATAIDVVHGQPLGLYIDGTVTDGSGTPMPGVLVKLFEKGLMIGSATSDEVGKYTVLGNPEQGEDSTVDLWFQSPDPQQYLDRNFLISRSGAAAEYKLFPGCTKEIKFIRGQASIDPVLMTEQETQTALAESKCLESGAGD